MDNDAKTELSAGRMTAWMTALAVAAALVAAALATLLMAAWTAWPALAPWSGPIAAALLAALVTPPVAWHLIRLRSALNRARQEAIGAGLRDGETGMFRRSPFLVLVDREWARLARYGGAAGLLVIEVDRLRTMTDRAGPQVADALLGGLAREVNKRLRGADLLARFDDAQLAVFLPEADPTGALDVADRIREAVEVLKIPGLPAETRLSASIGVAVMRPAQQPSAALMADAAGAVTKARQAGGNCVRMAPQDRRRPLQRGPASPGGRAARREGE